MSWDGIWIRLFGYEFGISFWRDIVEYEAVDDGDRVVIREQRHRFKPRLGRRVYYDPDDRAT